MQTPQRQFGDKGEDLAAAFLRSMGYRIVGRQVRVGRLGELDVIAEHRGTLVFVEVKTRRTAAYGPPEEALTFFKRRSLLRAIEAYRARRGLERLPYRLDVVAIEFAADQPVIRHHQAVALE